MSVVWSDLPAEVRRGLRPLVPGDTHPIVEVQFFAKDTPANAGMAIVARKEVVWDIVWDDWLARTANAENAPWSARNPWRRHHTRNYWVWFRRDGPLTKGGLHFTIETDGRVVWVNSERGLIGRFSHSGVDVHNVPGEPGTCEDCFPKPDWERFKASMLRVHGVVVDNKYKPRESRWN